MKTLTLQEAQAQFGQLIAEAAAGNIIVLTDGGREVVLAPRGAYPLLDLEQDGPELEAELLKAVRDQHQPLAAGELREAALRAKTHSRRPGRE